MERSSRPAVANRVRGGAAMLVTGQLLSKVAILLRSLIVVRTLTKVDWGIAATFAVSLGFVELSANMSVEILLVQARDGDEDRFQRTAHGMRFAQGVLVSLVLFLLAPVLADLFAVPDLAWAYQVLALAPLANSLIHFDPTRYVRNLRYGPRVAAEAGSQAASLAFVALLASHVQDYRLVLYALLCQPTAMTILTHVLATRRYGWAWDKAYVKRLFQFGWPLMLNGFLMYFVMHGDRLIIGSAETVTAPIREWIGTVADTARTFDKVDLAVYSTALAVSVMPASFVMGIIGNLAFPLLSHKQSDRARFADRYRMCAALCSVAATLISAALVLGGTATVVILYTERYRGVETVLGLLGTAQALRILRLAPITGALALADSKTPLLANIGRATGFIAAVVLAVAGAELAWLAGAALAAEVFSLAVAVASLRLRNRVPAGLLGRAAAFAATGISGAFAIAATGWLTDAATALATMVVYLGVVACAARVTFPQVLPLLREIIAARRTGRSA